MKILVALHHMMDLGGIINHCEQMIGGLRDLGHEVELREFIWRDNPKGNYKAGDWESGPSGIIYDQRAGWNFNHKQRICYRGAANIYSAVTYMSQFDMIIWEIPVPSKSKENMGNNDWPYLYDLPPHIKQIAVIHDGNAGRNYPYMKKIEHHLSGVACVHPCALNSSNFLEIPRALVVNPQVDPIRPRYSWADKRPGFVNMQTFKAWKKVHELIRAVAYMPAKKDDELREVAGEGIEYRYMTSEDKCKDEYFHDAEGEWFDKWKIWDAALGNDMTHHGVWNSTEVDLWLQRARVLVDPSWSDRYSLSGGHFNRVGVEAMMRGCVVIAREKGMGSDFFVSGVHYFAIPEDADPQQYADFILEISNYPASKISYMLSACLDLLPLFDRKVVAKRLLDLAHSSLGDVVMNDTGSINHMTAQKIENVLFEHFGIV